MNIFISIVVLVNTFLLVTILAIMSKLILKKTKVKTLRKEEEGLIDIPSYRTYGDIELNKPISTDIKLIKNE